MDKLVLIKALLEEDNNNKSAIWKIDRSYIIRTVTMIQVGKLIKVTDKELLIDNAAWVADTGRFNEALESGNFSEVEMFNPKYPVIIGRGAIVDAQLFDHALPTKSK